MGKFIDHILSEDVASLEETINARLRELIEATLGGEKYKGKSNPNNKLPHDHDAVKDAHWTAGEQRKEMKGHWYGYTDHVFRHEQGRLTQAKKAATKILKSSPHDPEAKNKDKEYRFKTRY